MRVEERGSVKLKGKRVNESLAVPDLQGGKLLSCCELGILSEISLARNAAKSRQFIEFISLQKISIPTVHAPAHHDALRDSRQEAQKGYEVQEEHQFIEHRK